MRWFKGRHARPAITVLTNCVPEPPRTPGAFVRQLISGKSGQTPPPPSDSEYCGHPAVTRSLVEGLRRLGVPATYNPQDPRDIAPVVVVLCNVDALRQAIAWRREGRITRLMAGPNLVVLPHEADGILLSPEIDYCLVPSEWVGIAYQQEAPSLRDRIRVWAAGVDAEWWAPGKRCRGNRALVYWKSEPQEFFDRVVQVVERAGLAADVMRYGTYTREEYRAKLARADVAIFISRSESQGLALAEAWSMDLPTLVWDPGELVYNGRRYDPVSSCPYMTDATGLRWKSFDELEHLLTRKVWAELRFAPRVWVLENMTDELCAQHLLRLGGAPWAAVRGR